MQHTKTLKEIFLLNVVKYNFPNETSSYFSQTLDPVKFAGVKCALRYSDLVFGKKNIWKYILGIILTLFVAYKRAHFFRCPLERQCTAGRYIHEYIPQIC